MKIFLSYLVFLVLVTVIVGKDENKKKLDVNVLCTRLKKGKDGGELGHIESEKIIKVQVVWKPGDYDANLKAVKAKCSHDCDFRLHPKEYKTTDRPRFDEKHKHDDADIIKNKIAYALCNVNAKVCLPRNQYPDYCKIIWTS